MMTCLLIWSHLNRIKQKLKTFDKKHTVMKRIYLGREIFVCSEAVLQLIEFITV